MLLDLSGMIPAGGAIFDFVNGAWYVYTGDWSNAAWSTFAIIPLVGDISKVPKVIKDSSRIEEAVDVITDAEKINKLPSDDSQLKHIFRNAEGHLSDTPSNRNLLENVSGNKSNLMGVDKYGNSWYAQIQSDGSQIWVETRKGVITNGGVNTTPRSFDTQTGLNRNPLK